MKWDEMSQFHVYWESSLIMMLTRVGTAITCFVMFTWLMIMSAHINAAQVTPSQPNPSSIYTQQAVTQVQVTEQAAEIARLRASQETQDNKIQALSNDLSSLSGMGKAAVIILGLLTSLQITLQLKGAKKSG